MLLFQKNWCRTKSFLTLTNSRKSSVMSRCCQNNRFKFQPTFCTGAAHIHFPASRLSAGLSKTNLRCLKALHAVANEKFQRAAVRAERGTTALQSCSASAERVGTTFGYCLRRWGVRLWSILRSTSLLAAKGDIYIAPFTTFENRRSFFCSWAHDF